MNIENIISLYNRRKDFGSLDVLKLLKENSSDYSEYRKLMNEDYIPFKNAYIKLNFNDMKFEHNMRKDFIKYLIDKYGN